METLTSIENFRPAYLLSPEKINNILLKLNGLQGIVSADADDYFVRIEYFERLVSLNMIKDAMNKAGFPFEKHDVKKGVFRKLILKLGEDNRKEFGGKPPKCCG